MPCLSLDLADDIARPFEGFRHRAYHDPVGFPTQGYGRLLSRVPWSDLSKYPDIDEHTGEMWLQEDMRSALASVRRLISVPLTDHQEAALIDFAYNCGGGNLQASTLRRVINRGEFDAAPAQFMRWTRARGVKLNGLVRRRAAEVSYWRVH